MKLTEFSATRSRLEDQGFEEIAKVFAKQKSIQQVYLYQNGAKRGMKALLKSLVECKDTLKVLHI